MAKSVTRADLEKLEQATAEAFSILAGLLAEALGPLPVTLHLRAALDAAASRHPDPLRDRLLRDAYRLALIKARHQHPDDPTVESLYASELGRLPTKH